MSINGIDQPATDLAGPVVKCGCGFTITGHLPEDSVDLLDQHDCPLTRKRDLYWLPIVLLAVAMLAAIVAIRIWGN